MVLKFLGLCMVVGAGGFGGMCVAQNYFLRPKHIKTLLALLQMLATEIRYGATPLPLALQTVGARAGGIQAVKETATATATATAFEGDNVNGVVGHSYGNGLGKGAAGLRGVFVDGNGPKKSPGDIFLEAGRYMETEVGLTSAEAWDRALRENLPRTALGREDGEVLRSLAGVLGQSDREDQEKHITLATEQLKIHLTGAEEAAAKNGRLWQYLGFLGGLAVALVLL